MASIIADGGRSAPPSGTANPSPPWLTCQLGGWRLTQATEARQKLCLHHRHEPGRSLADLMRRFALDGVD